VAVFAAVVVFNSDIEDTEFAYRIFRFSGHIRTPKNLTAVYKQWKLKHNKTYGGAEDQKRYKTFSDNFRKVVKINSQQKSFTVGLNQFADLANAEFSSIYLGYKKKKNATKKVVRADEFETEIEAVKVKASNAVDWRTVGAVTPIKNQGQCGSCWAFSSTGSLEGLNFLKNGNLLSFSEQQFVDCAGVSPYDNEGCDGGSMESALQYAADFGVELESVYPYTAVDGTCQYDASSVVFKNTAYVEVTASSDSALQAAVDLQPVSVAVEADQDVFQLYTGGVLDSAACGTNLDHGVLVVGYGTDTTTGTALDYWIVKNSWGPTFGESGYLRIFRQDGDGICGINLDPSYPTL